MGALRLLWGLLPPSVLKNLAARLVGYRVHASARVHVVLLLSVDELQVEPRATIGALSVFRGLRRVSLAEGSIVGQLNWISAAVDFHSNDTPRPASQGVFSVGREAALTNRHYVDASGGVAIGDFATLAGVRSTIISHGIDTDASLQSTSAVSIGEYALVSSNVKIVPGGRVPAYSVIAMGATVTRHLEETYTLYGGTPARAVKFLPRDSAYFSRSQGPVRVGESGA